MSNTVDIPTPIKDALLKFRFAKRIAAGGHAAFVVKVNKQTLEMEEENTFSNISLEDLAEELPESKPRYIVISYKLEHPEGRISYPLVLINWAPNASETGLLTLHASALMNFQNTADVSKVIDIRENFEELFTKENFDKQLLTKY